MELLKERKIELDLVKGIGIIFMVLGHMHFSDDLLNHYVYAFHMPLFFVVSGMLFRKSTLKDTLCKKTKSLLIPYFVFGGSYWCI